MDQDPISPQGQDKGEEQERELLEVNEPVRDWTDRFVIADVQADRELSHLSITLDAQADWLPCLSPAPPSALTPDQTWQVLLSEWAHTHAITDLAFEGLRKVLAFVPPGAEIPSKFVLETLRLQLSGFETRWFDCCPNGCASYASPKHRDLLVCPNPKYAAERYFPPGYVAPKQKRPCVSPGAVAGRTPRAQHAFYPIRPLVNAVLASQTLGPALLDAGLVSAQSVQEERSFVSSLSDGLIFRSL